MDEMGAVVNGSLNNCRANAIIYEIYFTRWEWEISSHEGDVISTLIILYHSGKSSLPCFFFFFWLDENEIGLAAG